MNNTQRVDREKFDTVHATEQKKVIKRNGTVALFDENKLINTLKRISIGYEQIVDINQLLHHIKQALFDGIRTTELAHIILDTVVSFLEHDKAYDVMSCRLLLEKIYTEVLQYDHAHQTIKQAYTTAFVSYIHEGIAAGILAPELATFDLQKLAAHLDPSRDQVLRYLGLEILYSRYFIKKDGKHLEAPQMFWMRVAMGLALREKEKDIYAQQFYDLLSSLDFLSSTPTLFHSGLVHSQLSSCYLTTVNDDLGHIFKCIGDNAQLAKWAGGIGNDWTNIRGTGSLIKSIRATSQGVIPFIKIANDVVVGITRTGIRRGGTCVYLETWHYDIEEFLDLRRNTGDERRRAHDLSTAHWIPDLFMKRVMNDESWTLFSPHEVTDLHDSYGTDFENKYCAYEQQVETGAIKLYKKVSAQELWRKMLSRLFETGHPWITFKDPCNIRSPQDHVGVVHSSNLCTEITLNTSPEETAVCNLGSINLSSHITQGIFDQKKIEHTVHLAVRMLDNVIDLNFYPTQEARISNMRHRPIGLGIMGFQDALYKMNINFNCPEAADFADKSMEIISYQAIDASCKLAQEKGPYETFKGSKWDRGIFPFDTLALLERERGLPVDVDKTIRLDWNSLKKRVAEHGLRNSNTLAIAPTATIANIAGCFPSIEPIYKNLYVKSNVSGEFTIVNQYLVEDLKKLHLWNQEMIEQIKYFDGNITEIAEIPHDIRQKYQTAFELDPVWLIKVTAARGKWIDQSQSHNVFMHGVSGKKLNDIYMTAFACGLKTTYYLRTLGASQIEKSTLSAKKFGFTQKRQSQSPQSCSLANPSCESCQ